MKRVSGFKPKVTLLVIAASVALGALVRYDRDGAAQVCRSILQPLEETLEIVDPF
jgi:CRISPR/Cas system-associated protein Csm6